MNTVKKVLGVVCLAALLAGCNTISGAGQDISAGGHAISRAAS